MTSLFSQGARPFSSTSRKSQALEPTNNPHTAIPQRKPATQQRRKRLVFDPRDVPYPLSYDHKVITLDLLDHLFIQQSRKNRVTWVDFTGGTPKRSLDVGCGTGDWIMEAAVQWKDCHFVGLDIAPIQPGPVILSKRGIADRVKWVNGNFLTARLPFEDDSFDHVHLYRISWGVAEDSWDGLFEEIARVLRPGGAIEIGEEDILFPILSPSYTVKLKPRPETPISSPLSPVKKPEKIHAHALLESLFFGVFASRRINTSPTSIIHHYVNIHFRNVITTPYVALPMPPPPVARQNLRRIASDLASQSQKSNSTNTSSSTDSASSLFSSSEQAQRQDPSTNTLASSSLGQSELPIVGILEPLEEKRYNVFSGSFEPADPQCDVTIIPPMPIDLTSRNLAVHLNSSFRRILGCKDAMWDELRRRLHLRNTGGPDLLSRFGWDDVNDAHPSYEAGHGSGDRNAARELEAAQKRFEEMTVRFERDMLHRTALADAIEANLGWRKPAPEPLSKYERMRQRELDRAIAEAVMAEPEGQEQAQVSRNFKGFIGFKEGGKG